MNYYEECKMQLMNAIDYAEIHKHKVFVRQDIHYNKLESTNDEHNFKWITEVNPTLSYIIEFEDNKRSSILIELQTTQILTNSIQYPAILDNSLQTLSLLQKVVKDNKSKIKFNRIEVTGNYTNPYLKVNEYTETMEPIRDVLKIIL